MTENFKIERELTRLYHRDTFLFSKKTFLQKLKAYQTMLSETRDVLLLSSQHPLFDLLLSPPSKAKEKK